MLFRQTRAEPAAPEALQSRSRVRLVILFYLQQQQQR